MHTEQGVEIESISSGKMENLVRSSLLEPETMGSSPTNDIASTLPYELLEKPSPITEELPIPIGPEKKCQNAEVSQKVLDDTESDWDSESETVSIYVRRPQDDTESDWGSESDRFSIYVRRPQDDTESDWDSESERFSIYVRRPLTKEEIRVRKRNSFLKFACGLLFGGSSVLVLCVLLVKWIPEFSQRKEDELIMVCLVFLSLGLWSGFLLFMFQFLVACPPNCEFTDDDLV